jgi:hypothetical protein
MLLACSSIGGDEGIVKVFTSFAVKLNFDRDGSELQSQEEER